MVNAASPNSLPRYLVDAKPAGAAASASGAYAFARMAACGQNSAHLLHWMHRVAVPDRDLGGDAALLELARARRPHAVRRERADGQQVAAAFEHRGGHALHEVRRVVADRRAGPVPLARRGRGHLHLAQVRERGVDGGDVLPHGLFAALLVGLPRGVADLLKGECGRDDVRQREEARLHHGVDASAEARLARHGHGVDREQPQPLRDEVVLHLARQRVEELLGRVRRIQEHRRARRREREHVLPLQEPELMARDEVRLADQVRRADRLTVEAQVRHRDRAGLLRVVDEVGLRVQVGRLADDLDRVLVRADRPVGAEPVEDGPEEARIRLVGLLAHDERRVRDVVDDADGEAAARRGFGSRLEDGAHHRGRELLRRKPVAAADDARAQLRPRRRRGVQRGDDVEIERLAGRARLLRAVEHGERLHGDRQHGEERRLAERPVEPHLHDADLLAARREPFRLFLRRLGAGAHDHDHALGLGMAVIFEEVVAAARQRGEALHRLADDAGHVQVEGIRRLARLEEDVGVLRRAADLRAVGREPAQAVHRARFGTDELREIGVGQLLDAADFVRRAEAVEEVQERHARTQRRRVADRRHVVRLLRVAGGEQRPPRLAAGHDVRMVAEDRERMGRQRARGDVDAARREFARDLVEVRDHQQQALRRRKGRREGPRREGAVEDARRPPFRLHLDDVGDPAPDVRLLRGRPLVRQLGHRGGRGDRIDRDRFAEPVGHGGGGFVPVDHRAAP
jgi:hypothetical protein